MVIPLVVRDSLCRTVKDEVVRDPGRFISDALSFAGGLDSIMGIQNAEKGDEKAEAFSSRWMELALGLPGALELEYKQEGREGFLERITPKVKESTQIKSIPRGCTVNTM
jgi:hypothetical protein